MSDEIADNQNLYKYRVGSSWYTFDKSILPPEDLRVFELANWKDKLKIITIYNDLKKADDDDVVILKSKTEDSNKDVKVRQYKEQKEKLEEELDKLNEKQNKEWENATSEEEIENINKKYEAQISAINKKLASLDTMYSDVISVKRIDALDSAKSNKLILKNVKDVLDGANKTLNDLKTTLTKADFTTIENIFKSALQAETKGQLSDNIDLIKNTIEDIKKSNASEPKILEKLLSFDNSIRSLQNSASSNEYIDYIIDNLMPEDFKTKPFIQKISIVSNLMDEAGVKPEDIKNIWDYPLARDTIKDLNKKDKFKYITVYGNLIKLYNDLKNNEGENVKFGITDKAQNLTDLFGIMSYFGKYPYLGTREIYKFTPDTNKKVKKLNRVSIGEYLLYKKGDGEPNVYEEIKTIVDNKQPYVIPSKNEVQTTGGLFSFSSNAGFLGLKTSKSARQDFEKLIGRITDLENKIQQLNEEIKQVKQEQSRPLPEPVKPVVSRPREMSFLSDINQGKPQLKHVEPQQRAPEMSELERIMSKRRTDIEPDEYEEEENDFGEGLGGLLGELQEDLKRYGLALSLAPDEKAYFLNVYEKGKGRKKKASGVVEARKLVNAIAQDTEYKDLKRLYESLY